MPIEYLLPTLDAHAHLHPTRFAEELTGCGAVLAMSLSQDEGAATLQRRPDPLIAWGAGRPISVPVLHWWTGTAAETREAVPLGCYFSIHSQVAWQNFDHNLLQTGTVDLLPEGLRENLRQLYVDSI